MTGIATDETPTPMSRQTMIAHYRIVSKIGEGGMGVVYRATDTKLNRDVAIKVLPAAFADDPGRMQRLEREAQVLASLNHPNVAAIYGVEQGALVMEFVEGQDLQGPLPVETAIEYARQIAAGLEAAHEKGVIHRDLKPANIKVTPAGAVKLLDFGLAKAADPGTASAADSPTLTIGATRSGTILGTAGYMAPEQARGRTVDKRADIWAFGVVFYEMLTGKLLFAGEDNVTDILAAIVVREPDWSALPGNTPRHVRRLIERCLRKDPAQRLRDIGEARIALHEADAPEPASSSLTPKAAPASWVWAGWALAAIAIVAAGAAWWRALHPETAPVLKTYLLAPEKTAFDVVSIPALSRDGRRLAFVASTERKKQIWVHDLDSASSIAIPGSEGGDFPFWSPDARFVAFFARGKLWKADLAGGSAVVLCDAIFGQGGSWNRNDVIVFAPGPATPLFRVSASGGAAVPLTAVDPANGEISHRFPSFLPDGRHFLFTVRGTSAANDAIYAGELESDRRVRLFAGQSNAVFSMPGFVLFARGGSLLAQPTDSTGLKIRGDPIPVADHVTSDLLGSSARFTASLDGLLAFYSGGSQVGASYLTWYDRAGNVVGKVGPPSYRLGPAISPGGDMVVEERVNPTAGFDLWLHHLDRDVDSRLTFDQKSSFPVWSPDGGRILFQSIRSRERSALCLKSALGAGKEECLYEMNGNTVPTAWTHDGAFALLCNRAPQTGYDIWILPLAGDHKPYPLLQTPANESNARLSPDGRWFAYQSDESGSNEIYVQAFPGKEGKWQISTQGGTRPVWSRDGKELFYIAADRKMMAVAVKSGGSFEHGTPAPLFETRTWELPTFDVSRDGKRFLMVSPAGEDTAASMNLIVNWQSGMRR